jgi:dephospho-CoA kinase
MNKQISGKFFITGVQGSGKTTVGRVLRRQGYKVFDIDHTAGLGKLRQLASGKLYDFVDIAAKSPNGLVDWSKYWFELQGDRLKEILASGRTVFVTGSTSNCVDYYNLFDKVFVMVVDPETVRTRLINHEHASHHLPIEIDRIVETLNNKQQILLGSGNNTVAIDARASLEEIVRAIKVEIIGKNDKIKL